MFNKIVKVKDQIRLNREKSKTNLFHESLYYSQSLSWKIEEYFCLFLFFGIPFFVTLAGWYSLIYLSTMCILLYGFLVGASIITFIICVCCVISFVVFEMVARFVQHLYGNF